MHDAASCRDGKVYVFCLVSSPSCRSETYEVVSLCHQIEEEENKKFESQYDFCNSLFRAPTLCTCSVFVLMNLLSVAVPSPSLLVVVLRTSIDLQLT